MIASSGRAGVDCGLSPLSVKLLGESHNYSSGSKATADTLNSAVHLGRVSSIDSEPDSEYEDELVFDDLDSPDPAGSSERPSASVLSSSRGLSPTDRIAQRPSLSLMRPSLSISSASMASWSSRFSHTALATSPPAISSFTYSSSAPAFASTSAVTAGSSSQVSQEEYLDFVSASTRNVQKRRQRADIHRRASGALARPKLSQLEEEPEYRPESACVHCGGQPSGPSAGSLLSQFAALSLPAPASPWSREALDTPASRPFSSALLASKLAHAARKDEDGSVTELGRRSARDARASPRLHRTSRSRGRHPHINDLDETLERALSFANWSKRGRAGVWQPPLDASQSLIDLVAALEDREDRE